MAEIEQGYTPDWEVPELLPVIGENVVRCRNSEVASDFEADLKRAEAFLAKHDYDPESTGE